jgi:nicotinamidase-related amidase
MATVKAEPYEFEFDPRACALVVIDMQRDFVDPGGFGEALGNDVSLLRKAIAPTKRVLDAVRGRGMLVIHTREGHRPDLTDLPLSKKVRGKLKAGIGDAGPMGRILVRGEYGHDIIDELKPAPGEPVIDKPGKGAFYATPLHELLQQEGITHLLFMGVTTEVCVQTSMREANDRGYDGLLLEDCTESYFPAFKAAAVEMVRAQGAIVGWTASSGQLLAVLQDC